MKKLSRFDLGVIIAFIFITLLGIGGWYYFSGQLAGTKADVSSAASDFDQYSKRQPFLPTQANEKILQSNMSLIQAQLDPVVQTKLQASGNKLSTVVKEDTVAWKHDLDAEVSRLNLAAKAHGVTVPNNFYFGFSRYLNQNPGDEETVVLSKQLLGVEEIANIFINANVKSIGTFRRTYEEDADAGGSNSAMKSSDADNLPGAAVTAPGNTYLAYPFEIEFDSSTASFRKIVDSLGTSPYVFVIRSVTLQNSSPASPQIGDLQKLAGTSPGGVLDSSPGAVSGSKSTRGPQFLFGNEYLHIKVRLDMIEWIGNSDLTSGGSDNGGTNGSRNHGGGRGQNQ